MGEQGKYTGSVGQQPLAYGLEVWAPVFDFETTVTDFAFAENLMLRTSYEGLSAEAVSYFLSPEELDRCRAAGHWLHLRRPVHSTLSTRAHINAVLLSLWISRPTRAHVAVRFEENAAGERTIARLLDRMQWIKGHVDQRFEQRDLKEAAQLVLPLRHITAEGRRLRTALVLTYRGCVSSDWQAAYICFAAATETLLTYSRAPRVSERLADAFAAIVATSEQDRRVAKDTFKRLYDLRSDIVHGRAYDRPRGQKNLDVLADFVTALRRLWSTVLHSKELCETLESDDNVREAFFRNRVGR